MAKVKKAFFCENCGAQYSKWQGKCNACGAWNTITEEIISKPKDERSHIPDKEVRNKPVAIHEIQSDKLERIQLNDNELNRVLGGGLVHGSITLIGGEPGIGKSTLLLQMALQNKIKVMYISGEESGQQIKMRAERINGKNDACFVLTETQTQQIFQHIPKLEPELLIIDSIQTLHTARIDSSPGSVSQIRECTAELQKYAKDTSTPVFLIGHITKEGTIAGPKLLEHMVDTVLQFEGDRNYSYRLLRSVKNRFGSTNELGIYEMDSLGLKEISNPSELLVSNTDETLSGIAIGAIIEGIRPLLIEVQALVSTSPYGTPQRTSTGFDLRRLSMLLAVLEKKCGFKLGAKDVFLNITGGIRSDDPATDLAVVCSILSSHVDIPIDKKTCMCAEVGLSGELRPVNKADQRISEAEKLGYERIIIAGNSKISQSDYDIELVKADKMQEVVKTMF